MFFNVSTSSLLPQSFLPQPSAPSFNFFRFGAAFMPGPSFGSVVYFTNDGSVKYSIFRMYTKLGCTSTQQTLTLVISALTKPNMGFFPKHLCWTCMPSAGNWETGYLGATRMLDYSEKCTLPGLRYWEALLMHLQT
ncbi:unnamed protein product [Prunus armeniaca]|uniref:Uncharacterized protein n=1 Tax=Prunus armeniaca TaxID=36596 RepID=A0A6J5XZ16_PRUAR|nr:unnamed protein product [Prunus armeniaca]